MKWSRAQVSSRRAGSSQTGASQSTRAPGLHIANPALTRMAQGFCAAITTMFSSMAHAVDIAEQSGFDESGWLPLRSCTYSGGDYVSALHGDRFLIAERAKLGSLDDLNHLLHAGQA
jgi:roadblock/LC7 domain-containing protein